MGLPYPVLADEDGRVHATLGAMAEDGSTVPALYVADRFGEIYSAFRGEGGVPLPSGEEVLTWLRFIEHQCPE
jgi:peroxiredoxin